MTIRPILLLLVGLAGVPACGGDAAGDEPLDEPVRAEELTRRQRDSVIGNSGLPGAQGVRRALDASDAAAARAAAFDSAAAGY